MITSIILKKIMSEARPIIERQLDDAELIAGFRDVIAESGGDWSSLKALIKAQIQDERDDAGDGKRVRKILDKADYAAAYADMLGLGKMNDQINSADYHAHLAAAVESAGPRVRDVVDALAEGGALIA